MCIFGNILLGMVKFKKYLSFSKWLQFCKNNESIELPISVYCVAVDCGIYYEQPIENVCFVPWVANLRMPFQIRLMDFPIRTELWEKKDENPKMKKKTNEPKNASFLFFFWFSCYRLLFNIKSNAHLYCMRDYLWKVWMMKKIRLVICCCFASIWCKYVNYSCFK